MKTMKLTIFAATGGIGRHALDLALAAGHTVTAVVRDPSTLPDDVHTVTADLLTASPEILQNAIAGADAVLSGLGPRKMSQAGVTSKGTAAIIEAMKATDVRRLVIVSAAPIGTVASPANPNPPKRDPGDGLLTRNLMTPIVKRALRVHYADLAIVEDMLRESGLNWTSIRPPRLTDKKPTGKYRTAIGQNLRGGLTVSRADVADLLLRVLDQPETIRRTVGVAN
jgi:putative NADH-flavin reductase